MSIIVVDPKKSVGEMMSKGKSVKEIKSEEEWKKILSPEEFKILRKKGTEPPFTGKYYNEHRKGVYTCAACGNELFTSDTKYDSGSGWPSFYQPFDEKNIETKNDYSFFMKRTEILCSKCESHLGHVFDDGPEPTGLRYCVNSASLNFIEKDEEKDSTD